MLFRLRCHFCGARSRSSKGTTEFQCQSCEAWNFYNKKGDVVDTPARVAAAPRSQPVQMKPSKTFAQPGSIHSQFACQDSQQPFCQTCLTNQRIYTESLGNYLPDEDHPQYYEYEQKLPQYKADLEKRYPQICKKCGPKAQATISRADRYGLQQNVSKNIRDTIARRGKMNKGQRDDWGKRSMRMIFILLRGLLYASLLVQVAWHAYALFTALFVNHEAGLSDPDSPDMDGLAFDPTLRDCANKCLRLRFLRPCLGLIGSLVPKTLLTSILLLWYNPGMALWYHDTIRVEHVFGQSQYFTMQLILLVVRTVAWLNLSNPAVTFDLTKSQLLAAHGFMGFFVPLLQRFSERVIRFDAWRMKGRMMPSPEEEDAFSAFAGPERDSSPPRASSVSPVRLFARNTESFPIESLAPRATRSSTRSNLPYQPPPSPPDSVDEMDYEMDTQPAAQPQMPGAPVDRTFRPRQVSAINDNYNHGMAPTKGWTPMRNSLFGIISDQEAADQRKREQEQQARLEQEALSDRSPFHGALPPDPMERRYRGAAYFHRPEKKEVPLTQRPEYFDQMSKSFGSQRFGPKTPSKIGNLDRSTRASTRSEKKNVSFAGLGLNDDDEDFSPVKHRRQTGSLNAREGQWKLPDTGDSTGLEDLFGGGSFRIADHEQPAAGGRTAERKGAWLWKVLVGAGLPVLMVAVGWNVVAVRRAVCLWLAERLEGMGY